MNSHENEIDMKKMYLLCYIKPMNTAPSKARKLEMALIALFKGQGDGRQRGRNINIGDGGEGINDDVTDTAYYIYCVIDD
jgi:hypothetical protein